MTTKTTGNSFLPAGLSARNMKIYQAGHLIGQCHFDRREAVWRFHPSATHKPIGPKSRTWEGAVSVWYEAENNKKET